MSTVAALRDELRAELPPGLRLPSPVQLAWFIRDRVGMLETCARRYGDFFTIRIPWQTLVMLSDPEAVKQVFTGDPDVYHAGKANEILRPFLGDYSVLLLDGVEHVRQRRLLLPPFHGERMLAYGELIRDVTLDELDRFPRDRAFPIHPHMQEITLAVIMRAVFGMTDGPRAVELKRRLQEFITAGSRSVLAFLPFLQWDLGEWSPFGWFRRRLEEIDAILFAEIAERRSRADGESGSDILSLLLAARDEAGKPMTPQELRDELLTLLVAGHETTATSLAWAFYYLLGHPAVEAQLRNELARVFGDGPVSADRLPELRYLDAVIKETGRLRPIIVFVGRQLQQPVDLGGYRLPAGTTVAPCIYLTQRRPDLYPEPGEFRPERFLDGKPTPYEFFPFGGGARRCLGMAFALYEMRVVLATLFSRVGFALPADTDVRPVRRSITIAPSDGTRVVVTGVRPVADRAA